jgi:hypothetical protein
MATVKVTLVIVALSLKSADFQFNFWRDQVVSSYLPSLRDSGFDHSDRSAATRVRPAKAKSESHREISA